jgi:hypothetical protein
MKDSSTTIMQGYAQSLFNNKATTSTTLTAPWVSKCLVALTVFDAVIVVLTWREYRRQRRIPQASESGPPHHAPTGAVER